MAAEPIGVHYGRMDLERVGLFVEMGYMHGKGYTGPVTNVDIRDRKKAQMHPGVPKWKTGLQDCYFDQKFKRIFEKEAYTNPHMMAVNDQRELRKKYPNLKPFLNPGFPKKHATPGDYFGTFSGIITAISPVLRPRVKQEKLGPNFKTNPGKKGGPGYPDITINKYPAYKPSPYDDPKTDKKKEDKSHPPFLGGGYGSYFDKNPYLTDTIKIQSTYKEEFPKTEARHGPFIPASKNKTLDGCFSKWPEYKSSLYTQPKVTKAAAGEKSGPLSGPFKPQPQNKSMYTHSIMGRKVDIALNSQNWQTFKPVTYTREFLV